MSIATEIHTERAIWLLTKKINGLIKTYAEDQKLVAALKQVRAEAISVMDPLPSWAKDPDSVRDVDVYEANRRMEMEFPNWNARSHEPSKGPRT